VLDYLWGPHAQALITALPSSARTAPAVTYIQTGSLAGPEFPLDASMLRSKNLTLRGTGPGSWSIPQAHKQLKAMTLALTELIGTKELTPLAVRKLEEVDEGFADKKNRTVFVI